MTIRNLHIENIRSHVETFVELTKGVNFISGLNGSGKTSILEGIAICGFSKTFLPTSDSDLIRYNQARYISKADCVNRLSLPHHVTVSFDSIAKKQIRTSVKENANARDLIGELPMVVVSPDFKAITFGAPQDRRSFVDRALSQMSIIYFDLLLQQKRLLKQRNTLLTNAKSGYVDSTIFDAWTEELISINAKIALKRSSFILQLNPLVQVLYRKISSQIDEVEVLYKPDSVTEIDTLESIENQYRLIATQLREQEFRRQTTLFGIQKDDVLFTVNKGIARDVASQGQHKTLLIALKLSEFNLLQQMCAEKPILLFDDIFSELDEVRCKNVLNLTMQTDNQTIITTTETTRLLPLIHDSYDLKTFDVTREHGISSVKVRS